MSQNVSATRMELLRIKARKKLAIKGYNLLKKKRDTLIKMFFAMIKDYKRLKKSTIESLHDAYETLHIAQGVSGVNRMKSFALSTYPSHKVHVAETNLMGVRVPKFCVEQLESPINASLIGTAYYVKDARDRFQSLFPELVKLAEIEQVIFKLAEEIKKTKRRVNALEYIKIPELDHLENTIKSQLAEMERESFTRLKNVKKKLASHS